jgi:hypothetical protein
MAEDRSIATEILRRKAPDELIGMWQRRGEYPAETVQALQAVLEERGIVTPVSDAARPRERWMSGRILNILILAILLASVALLSLDLFVLAIILKGVAVVVGKAQNNKNRSAANDGIAEP